MLREGGMRSITVKKDFRTKKGVEFKRGEKLRIVNWTDKAPFYLVSMEADDGRRVSTSPRLAFESFKGFSKPPSIRKMEEWASDGVAKAVDGARVELDGFSPAGAPSWLLVMGMI